VIVVDAALGLYTIEGIGRYLEFAQQVGLGSEFLF
jgi:hypothetical protein